MGAFAPQFVAVVPAQPEGEDVFAKDQRVVVRRGSNPARFATVLLPHVDLETVTLFVQFDDGSKDNFTLGIDAELIVEPLDSDGSGKSSAVLAGMWTTWMDAASANAETSALATTTLKPYAHQTEAVYGAMLPQPQLRFLLADEPGTGKTIMAGLYIREMQRLGLLKRAIVVCPANLATKWVEDFDRLLGGGLRHLTAETVKQDAVNSNDLWVVSLELAAVNPQVLDAIRPDKAGWDLVVFDEAHRLTPTASSMYQVGSLLAKNTPRALLMTATPHRGKEWLFRHLLHLVDPEIYPDPGMDQKAEFQPLKPGPIHFLRRMKEDLVNYDGVTRLFKDRHAQNEDVPLSGLESAYYITACDMVDQFFPPAARQLARMVYGKRAASTLHALRETLERRERHMNEMSEAEADLEARKQGLAYNGIEDEAEADEAKVTHTGSLSSKAERSALKDLIAKINATISDPGFTPSKWTRFTGRLAGHGIVSGGSEQAVVFTEYTDSAEWIAKRLIAEGYTARVYSGRQSRPERDETRREFMAGAFQVIVTTDAGNEGIDLQAAHVLVNYDIPWSLVRLEQRMGRIHRVGQTREVFLYNLVATDTREGETLLRLLDNFVTAANELKGQMFDSLSAVAEISGVEYDKWLSAIYGDDEVKKHAAIEAARAVNAEELKRHARKLKDDERQLASKVEAQAALTLLQRDLFSRINPAIVEAFLQRLSAAGLIKAPPTAAGEGFHQLSFTSGPLPAALGGGASVHVATSGEAVATASAHTNLTGTVTLGPGEAGFSALIDHAKAGVALDMHKSGAVADPTSLTGYDLYAYQAELVENGGARSSVWATLIKVDNGLARPVRWETLANLVPTDSAGAPEHPASRLVADACAAKEATKTSDQYRQVRGDWHADARKSLASLPTNLTTAIKNRTDRVATRDLLKIKVESRLDRLSELAQVTLTAPRFVGRLRVHAAPEPDPTESPDSERVSMKHVILLLVADGWNVADVSRENRGYDLDARRGSDMRAVEVKGVLGDAASDGVRMTGAEVLIATQQRRDYWLYVVDQCHDNKGRLFGRYQDPATLFSTDMKGDAIFRVPGSTLKTALGSEQ